MHYFKWQEQSCEQDSLAFKVKKKEISGATIAMKKITQEYFWSVNESGDGSFLSLDHQNTYL